MLRHHAAPFVLVIAVAIVGGAVPVAQQPPATTERRFDVASVKPALSPAEIGRQMALNQGRVGSLGPVFFGIRTMPGGRFQASTVTLKQLIARAFDVKDFQIDGGPAWLASDSFEIAASAGGDATPAEFNEMLRALLVDRFGLRTHTETREAPIHILTLARDDGRLGPGLRPTSPECAKQIADKTTPPQPADRTATPQCGVQAMMAGPAGATLTIGGMDMSQMVGVLAGELSAHVIDRTGLSGRFDVTLEYASRRRGGGNLSVSPAASDSPFPPLAEALQRQLGLKIDRQIGPLPVLVVDAANPPTPD